MRVYARMRRIGWLFVLLLFLLVPAAQAEERPAVSLDFTNTEVRDVLAALASVGETSVIVDDSVTGRITIHLEEVPFKEALELVTKAKGLTYQQLGSVIVVSAAEKFHKGFDAVHVIKLQHAKAEEVVGLLALAVNKGKAEAEAGKGNKRDTGGSGNTNADHANSTDFTVEGPSLVKTDVINRVQGAGRLRADMETNSILLYGSEEEAAMLRALAADIDVPYRQVSVEAEVVAVTQSAAKDLGVEWNWQPTPQYSGDAGSAEAANMGAISYGRSPAGTPYRFFYQAKINALLQSNHARLLAKPKVTTLNGKAARIHIGDQIPVVATTVSGGATTTSTEYKDAGIILQYTPRIDADGWISAALYTGVSTPVYVADLKAYRIAIREAETEVRMKNGETIVIGGLLDKSTVDSRTKIPLLGDLPLLGKLFQNSGSTQDETEIMIFLTARIVE
ncbi:MAG: pilQ [Firmicutes bacterium]|nr:pilQ [Bacillota bacterium]